MIELSYGQLAALCLIWAVIGAGILAKYVNHKLDEIERRLK